MVQDGHTGVEHNIPVVPLCKDVVNFRKSTESHNTPTLVVNYGSVSGEYYWYQHTHTQMFGKKRDYYLLRQEELLIADQDTEL